ncbi:hypothetical protein PDESU_05750 [Pontiella desulfatans]|uniref:TIR domain-containing protein n=1 Tax=Pontiella desulfatans TaxID=2750659 RepID=A0A6C2UAV9_PONDE|nr:TIR domain-containing protein [Pontiella desulfatans]VGO17155.1 hypothetical protein PDESU_05750 [Pontiella desulfatans]
MSESKPMRLFISYSSKSGEAARSFADKLRTLGYDTWLAPEEIHGGQDFAEQIMEGLDQCHGFVLLLTAEANESPHVKSELNQAFGRKMPILPVLLEEFELSRSYVYYLSHAQWVDASNGADGCWDEVTTVLDAWRAGRTPTRTVQPPLPFKRVRAWPKVAAGVAVAGLLALGVWKLAPNDAPSPEDENQVRRVASHMLFMLVCWDQQFGSFERYTEYLEGKVISGSDYPMDMQIKELEGQAAHVAGEMQNTGAKIHPFPEGLLAWIQGSPLNAADADAFVPFASTMTEELVNNVGFLRNCVDPRFVMSPANKRELLVQYRKWNRESAAMAWYGAAEFLAPLNQDTEGFRKAFREPLSTCAYLASLNLLWLDDQAECERLAKSAEERMNRIMNEMAALVGEEQANLSRQEDAMLPLLQKAEEVEQMEKQLAELEAMLAEQEPAIRADCTLLPDDDPGIMWGKIIRLMACGMHADASLQMDRFLEFNPDSTSAPRVVKAVKAYATEAAKTGMRHGAVVWGTENDVVHSVLRPGDIVVELNGEQVLGGASYVAIKQKSGAENSDFRYLRLDSNGLLMEHVDKGNSNEPRISITDIVEQMD